MDGYSSEEPFAILAFLPISLTNDSLAAQLQTAKITPKMQADEQLAHIHISQTF